MSVVRPPMSRWQCCKCGSDNGMRHGRNCSACNHDWGMQCCSIYIDNRTTDGLRSAGSVRGPLSSLKFASNSRPVITHSTPPSGQQYPKTHIPPTSVSPVINHNGKSLCGDLISAEPNQSSLGETSIKEVSGRQNNPFATSSSVLPSSVAHGPWDVRNFESALPATRPQSYGRFGTTQPRSYVNSFATDPHEKSTLSSKRHVVVTQASSEPQEKVSHLQDLVNNGDLSASWEHSRGKRRDTTAELEALSRSGSPIHEEIRKAVKGAPGVASESPSPMLDVAVEDGNDVERPSTQDGQRGATPEITIELGPKKDKGKKDLSISVFTKPRYRRSGYQSLPARLPHKIKDQNGRREDSEEEAHMERSVPQKAAPTEKTRQYRSSKLYCKPPIPFSNSDEYEAEIVKSPVVPTPPTRRYSQSARQFANRAEEYIEYQRERASSVPSVIGHENNATQSRFPAQKQPQDGVYDSHSESETEPSRGEEADDENWVHTKAPAPLDYLHFRPSQSPHNSRRRFVPSQSTHDVRALSEELEAQFEAAIRAQHPLPRRSSIDRPSRPQYHLVDGSPGHTAQGHGPPPRTSVDTPFIMMARPNTPSYSMFAAGAPVNSFDYNQDSPIYEHMEQLDSQRPSMSAANIDTSRLSRSTDWRENDRKERKVIWVKTLAADKHQAAIVAEVAMIEAYRSHCQQVNPDAALTTTSLTARYAPIAKSIQDHDTHSHTPAGCENMPQYREVASPSDVPKLVIDPVSDSAELHKTVWQDPSALEHTPLASSNPTQTPEILAYLEWMAPKLLAEMQPDLVSGSSDAPSGVQNVHSNGPVSDIEVPERQIARETVTGVAEPNFTAEYIRFRQILDSAELKFPFNLLVPDPGTRDTWWNAVLGNNTDINVDLGYEGRSSEPSSYAASVASVFSIVSLASSASDISRGSGYSAVQIATATKVLLSIFYEDEALSSLYKSALENQNIGPERLQRNLRRLFRAYARLLESEATERLEYLASQLVLVKSASLARSIVEKLQNGRVGAQSPRSERNEESSEEEEDNSASTHPVNEDAFEDLVIFREFLVESEAFRAFRVQLQAFVLPKPAHLTYKKHTVKRDASNTKTVERRVVKENLEHKLLTWQRWRVDAKQCTDGLFHDTHAKITAWSVFHLMIDAIMLTTDDLLIATGQLEPPLSPNMVRLRWQCACGDSLYSDVSELREDGIKELMSHMQRTSGAKVRASPYSHRAGNQQYVVPHPIQWIRKAVTSIFRGSAKKSSACLPQHNTSCTPTTTTPNPPNPPPQRSILHLLACMHRNRLRKVLKQDRIEDITTDRALLCFLRKQYRLHRGHFLHLLSLQSVKGISFVKFRLPIGGSVDVRHHDPCCVANTTGPKTCECIPPPPKVEPAPGAEYRCIPGPPATYPPIPPEYLASLFTCPTDVHEKDTWILDQLPRRTCGELKGQIGQPAEGWGIYYDEGLDGDMLAWTILVVFFIASLLFGVLWSRFQYDIEGAFGVSAYMVACCAAVLPVIVTRLGNKG